MRSGRCDVTSQTPPPAPAVRPVSRISEGCRSQADAPLLIWLPIMVTNASPPQEGCEGAVLERLGRAAAVRREGTFC